MRTDPNLILDRIRSSGEAVPYSLNKKAIFKFLYQAYNHIFFFAGYVCPRGDILSSGCCNTDSSSTVQYACETCKDNHCCAIYEYCISCCLHPNKVCKPKSNPNKKKTLISVHFSGICWKHFWEKPQNKIMYYLRL